MAARRVLIQIPQRTMARGRMREAARSFIPLRINSAGVMPIVFAQSVIVVPGAVAQFSATQQLRDFADYFAAGHGAVLRAVGDPHPVLHLLLHVDHLQPDRPGGEPEEAGRLHSGREAGREDGRVHRRRRLARSRCPGAIFLTIIALLPIWIVDGDQRAVPLRRHVAADRRRCRARHDRRR